MNFILMTVCAATLFSSSGCAAQDAKTNRPAPEIREGKRSINGTELFVRDVGPMNAPILIVVHGGPGGSHRGELPLERLAPKFRVVFYDQRGTGESKRLDVSPGDPQSLDQLSLEKNIEDLEELRKTLGREKVSVIGHSNGGALAVFYAAAHPEHVEKLIVYSGGPEDKELAEQKNKNHLAKLTAEERESLENQVNALQQRAGSAASQDELDDRFTQVVTLMVPALYCKRPENSISYGRLGFWANVGVGKYIESFDRKAFIPQLQKINSPTLLTWGRCEPSPQERLLYLLAGIPNSQLAIFEKSSHNAMKEEPDLFFKTIIEFLTGEPVSMKTLRSALLQIQGCQTGQ